MTTIPDAVRESMRRRISEAVLAAGIQPPFTDQFDSLAGLIRVQLDAMGAQPERSCGVKLTPAIVECADVALQIVLAEHPLLRKEIQSRAEKLGVIYSDSIWRDAMRYLTGSGQLVNRRRHMGYAPPL